MNFLGAFRNFFYELPCTFINFYEFFLKLLRETTLGLFFGTLLGEDSLFRENFIFGRTLFLEELSFFLRNSFLVEEENSFGERAPSGRGRTLVFGENFF